MASAIKFPINSSFPAEMEAMALISSLLLTGIDFFFKTLINSFTVFSIPFFKEMGFAPKATANNPDLIISLARTIAVVVPSPAKSFVLVATYQKKLNIITE